jgi:uroporphyrinogen decarboxylase
MEDIINVAKINAKHSNEDQIAPFSVWVERYGDRIGNFGGVDADVLCRTDKQQLKEYITDLLYSVGNEKGIAIGTGNSVPDYVPTENYINMIETVREYRKG